MSPGPDYIDYRPGDSAGPFWLHIPRLKYLLEAAGYVVTKLPPVPELPPELLEKIRSVSHLIVRKEPSSTVTVPEATKLDELERDLAAGARLVEKMSEENHRHPPNDYPRPETWAAIEAWVSRPNVVAAREKHGDKP